MDAYAVHRDSQRRNTHLFEALASVLGQAADGHGRTSVVLVSGGFVDDPTLAAGAKAVLQASLRSHASVYFVDVHGLVGFFETEKGGGAIAVDEEGAGAEKLAADTGGLSIRSSNDLAGGLVRIAEEARTYYLLGYVPDRPGKPGRFRRGFAWRRCPPA